MKINEFMRRQLSENGEPSNSRVCLFLLVTTVMLMIICSGIKQLDFTIPNIPATFVDLIEWLVFIFVGGVTVKGGINSVSTAYKEAKRGVTDGDTSGNQQNP